MENRQLALGAAALLVIGLFLPAVSLPMIGSVNLFNSGTNVVALIIAALAALGAYLAWSEKLAIAIWPSSAATAIVGYTFLKMQWLISDVKSQMARELADNPFAGIAANIAGSVQLQWGWIVLGAGAAGLVFAAVRARRQADEELESGEASRSKAVVITSFIAVLAVLALDAVPAIFHGDDSGSLTDLSANAAGEGLDASASGTSASNAATAQAQAYIRDNTRIYDVNAEYFDSILDGRVPGVTFKIQNRGDRSLDRVEVTVVFLDEQNRPIAEEVYNPVLVSEFNFENNSPLRPNYIWQHDSDRFYTAKSVPSEWRTGSVRATISDIEFSPQGT